jgi:hypothetical protein
MPYLPLTYTYLLMIGCRPQDAQRLPGGGEGGFNTLPFYGEGRSQSSADQ